MRPGSARRLAAGLLAATVAAGAWGCGGGETSAADASDRPGRSAPASSEAGGTASSLLLITVDTLRADALGFAGNERVETPVLDRLAAGGRVFPRAHAHNVVTLPSHANILTGRLPYEHGIRDNSGFVLPETVPTAATLLSDAGFATAAFVAAFPLDARYGLDRGFDLYDDTYHESTGSTEFRLPERRGDEVVSKALAWWNRHEGERRFLWIHLFDPHAPYEPPEPYASRYADDRYLGEVAAVDAFLAPLLEPLLGEASDTAVVFTSDHGEGLGEHGELTHGLFAYESTLRVPLVVRAPGLAPGTVDEPARHIDILPTLLASAGVAPPDGLPGRSLLTSIQKSGSPDGSGDTGPETGPVTYFEALSANLNRGWAPLRGTIEDGEKLIALPIPELYDLDQDEDESENLYGSRRPRARELARLLPEESEWPPPREAVSAEERSRLRSLGYLSGSAAAKERYTAADDPKNLISVDRRMHRFIDLHQRGRIDEAIGVARAIVRENPGMADGYYQLAQALLDEGRDTEALEVMENARKNDATTPALVEQLGLLLAQRGRAGEAVSLLAPLAESGDPDALNALGVALSEAGRQGEAREALLRVFDRDPNNPQAHQNLALVALRRQDFADARREARLALDADEGLPHAWNYLGVAQYNLGQPREAITAWERATTLDPENYDLLYNLGLVAAEQGDRVRARAALRRFADGAPPERYRPDIAQGAGDPAPARRRVAMTRRTRMTRKLALVPLVAALSLVAILVACGGDDDAPASGGVRVAEGTPVVLISVDTLRSDRLPMYGYDGVETPHLDAFREDSILFEHAYTHVPLTLPAHLSMFTGELPPEHGVRDNLGYDIDPAAHPWLPRTLKERGYATGGAVSAFVLRATTGMGESFDFYEDRILQRSWQLGEAQRTGDRTLDASREWLRSVAGEPFFFFFHIYEPHGPWNPPEPWASRYDDAYDGEVASADAIVGDLLDELKEMGVYDEALIVFVSDHGEGLGDHGLSEHGPLLYREQIQVPLVMKLPGGARAGESVARPAQLADLYPTVLDLLGIEAEDPSPDEDASAPAGTSLLALAPEVPAEGERTIFSETFFPRTQFGWSELTSAIRYPHHLIQGPDPELYDLAADPEESENVLRDERRAYAGLRDALRTYDGEFEAPTQMDDPETRARLASLGYIGSSATEESLADPKSKLGVLNDLGRGIELAANRRYPEAIAVYRRILDEEPNLTTAWEYLGNNLLRVDRAEEALTAYQRQMELSGGTDLAVLNVAGALFRLGRLEEAEEHALLATGDYPQAFDMLAQIALRRGALDRAEEYLAKSFEEAEGQPGPMVTRAELLMRQGEPEKALRQLRTVHEMIERDSIDRDLVRGLYMIEGEAQAELGNAQEAARAFQREIELYPTELAAYSRLALLYALSGRSDAVGPVLRGMVEANPTPGAYAEAARTLRVLGDEASAERLLRTARERWPDAPALRAPAG